MLKIFLLFCFFQISLLAFGQEGPENSEFSDADNQVVNELMEKREQTQALMEKINPEAVEKVVDEKVHPLIQIQKLGYQEINFKALNDSRVQAILDKALIEGLVANVPADIIHKTIMDKVSGTPVKTLFQKFPAILNKTIEILRDKEALPGLLKILTKKEDLKIYLTYWIIILIVTIWLKRTLLSKKAKWNFIQRIFLRLSLNLLSFSASMYAFYSIFEKELSPALKIIGLI